MKIEKIIDGVPWFIVCRVDLGRREPLNNYYNILTSFTCSESIGMRKETHIKH